jgi:hypothetical protein
VKVSLVMLGFAPVAQSRLAADREASGFLFPLTSSILVSLVVSLALWRIVWLLRR